VVALAWSVCRDLGLTRIDLLLNSLGDDACRPAYLDALRAYLAERVDELCDEHKLRAAENPLRVLDCKRPACRTATDGAPRMIDHLCPPCAAHFQQVLDGLAMLDVPVRIEPRLVRGLDYYTRTTFELAASALDSAQNAVGGGGRYDKLTEALGGPSTPGIGFGMGIERLLLACDAENVFPVPEARVEVFVVDTTKELVGGATAATLLAGLLRDAGIGADRAFDRRSMKSQFKQADRSGARLAVVMGDREAADGTVTLRDLRTGDQEVVPRADLVDHVRKRLS
jgi:histidyl-tRNA synthetase